MARKTIVSLLLLLSFTIVINSVHSFSNSNNAKVEFIRTSCDSTLHPTLCFASLVKHANIVDRDPVRLAHLATNVTRSRVRSVSLHVTALRRAPPGPITQRMSGALQDCSDSLSTAVEQTYMSATELGSIEKYEGAPGSTTAWRVFNTQTWMSAAMTNEQTCSDGLDDDKIGGGGIRDDVCGRVARAMEHTSIALGLVNCLVSN